MPIKNALIEIAQELKALGESQQRWERKQIDWQPDRPPFNDFLYYIALSAVWQTFSHRIEGETRKNLIMDLYHALKEVIKGKDFALIERVLKSYKASRFMAGVNLFALWVRVVKELKKIGFDNPLVIQKTAQGLASRTQHWLVYAPLEAAIVVGDIFPARPEIVPPLGKRVMAGMAHLGLFFGYPPIKRELEIIHQFLLHLAQLADTNHLIIEMGFWQLGRSE